MQNLGPAPPVPTKDELIAQLSPAILKIIADEMSDDLEPDRIWILRKIYKNYLYYRNLQNFAPQLYQSIVDFTGSGGPTSAPLDEDANGLYDYSQNYYKGYCRKEMAVLGNRMPNATAEPDNANDEEGVRATLAANNAAQFIRERCGLAMKNLYLTFGLFNFGTMFWHLDWVEDAEKYGETLEPVMELQPGTLGDASFDCPDCAAPHDADPSTPTPPAQCAQCGTPMSMDNYKPPTPTQDPVQTGTKKKPKSMLEISLHAADEISVPLDATSVNDDNCDWLRWDKEKSKARMLAKWGDKLRGLNEASTGSEQQSSQYAESVRSAMASPIGLVRARRSNRWTESQIWWVPAMYQLVEDKDDRLAFQQNYPKGLKITIVKGVVCDLEAQELRRYWQECKPEPSTRIMADPLGDDWLETTDILNNTLNQANGTIERSNMPLFVDPRYIDTDAWQNRRNNPAEIFPMLKPAGGHISDAAFQPPPIQFSEQIAPFRTGIQNDSESISGLLPQIWGGDQPQPTARQTELLKNAALMQLGVPWAMIGESLEQVYTKACWILSQFEEGVLEFSRKNQFGQYDSLAVVIEDLRSSKYHFEADEAIPMTWGQQRDLIMWMLDKPAPLLQMWGFDDPLNIFTFKQLLGMPGERTPKLDDRDKAMDVIAQLLNEKATPGQPGPPNPDGSPGAPGPTQPSIQPDWCDDNAFCASLAKAYLVSNHQLQAKNPDGWDNVVAWGQAHEQLANQPAPPPPPKATMAVSLKGQDLGSQAVQAGLTKVGLIPPGTDVQQEAPLGPIPSMPQVPNGMPPGVSQAPIQ